MGGRERKQLPLFPQHGHAPGGLEAYLLAPDQKFELFNLKEDISEEHNLAEQQPERVKAMARTMTALLKERKAQMPTYKKNNPAGAREGAPVQMAGPGGGQAVKASPSLLGKPHYSFSFKKTGSMVRLSFLFPFKTMNNLLSIEQLTGDEIRDLLALGHRPKGGTRPSRTPSPEGADLGTHLFQILHPHPRFL